MNPKKLPAFANEAQEADWWFENREKHAEEFIQAATDGKVTRGGVARRLMEAKAAATVSLPASDALTASLIAEQRGVGVQAYLIELIHTSLQKDLQSLRGDSDAA